MIQLFMSRSGSSVIVPLRFPASQSAIAEASCQLDEASREGKTRIVEIKSVIAICRHTSADLILTPERSLHN